MIPYTPSRPAIYIPVINLKGSFSGDYERRAAVAWEVHKAARDSGFFYVENHGIDQSVIDRAFAEARRFFEWPLDRKLEVSAEKWPCLRGYQPMQAQTLDAGSPPDYKESFYLAQDLGPDHPYVKKRVPNHGANQWPNQLPGFREGVEANYARMLDLGRHLIRLLALSLSLDENYFDEAFRNPAATLRIHRYPSLPPNATPDQMSAGAHTDFGAITLLAQDDCCGLEVENSAGEWLRADPIPGTIVVNLGDMIRRWTNDLYHSNMHRVLNSASSTDRYSMALFFNPDYFTRVECLPTCRPNTGELNYEPCTSGEHVAERIRLSYGKDAV